MAVRAERAAEVARLAAEGLTGRQIAARMGISRSYAYDLLTDPEGGAVRARKGRQGGVCEVCGAATSYGTGGPARRCHRHGSPRSAELQRERALPRYRRIVDLYRAGVPVSGIADNVGMTPASVSSALHRMRAEGWDVPYRRAQDRKPEAA